MQAIHRSQAHHQGLGWEAWRSHLFPRVFIYRGWKGWEPQGEEPYEWQTMRYESCWKLDASWMGWTFELMPTYQGRLSYQNKLPVDYWINDPL